ncbi:hypothetical protein D3C78_1742360 [compost metagenome]
MSTKKPNSFELGFLHINLQAKQQSDLNPCQLLQYYYPHHQSLAAAPQASEIEAASLLPAAPCFQSQQGQADPSDLRGQSNQGML